jgi:hypothetical protein
MDCPVPHLPRRRAPDGPGLLMDFSRRPSVFGLADVDYGWRVCSGRNCFCSIRSLCNQTKKSGRLTPGLHWTRRARSVYFSTATGAAPVSPSVREHHGRCPYPFAATQRQTCQQFGHRIWPAKSAPLLGWPLVWHLGHRLLPPVPEPGARVDGGLAFMFVSFMVLGRGQSRRHSACRYAVASA